MNLPHALCFGRRAPTKACRAGRDKPTTAAFLAALAAMALACAPSSASPSDSKGSASSAHSVTDRNAGEPRQRPTTAASPAPDAAPSALPAAAKEADSSAGTAGLSDLPQDVLVGTDVMQLQRVLAEGPPQLEPGTYRSEQGGAVARIELSRDTQEWTLVRRFAEPGMPPKSKSYRELAASGEHQLAGKGIRVLGAKAGILVLENNSGADGIPPTLWILYDLKKSGKKGDKQ